MANLTDAFWAPYRRQVEIHYPWFIGSISAILLFVFVPTNILDQLYTNQVLSSVITIAGILFGFLLTMLTFLLQTNNLALSKIREYDRLKDLVRFNRAAVYLAGLLTLTAFVLQVLHQVDFICTQPELIINLVRFGCITLISFAIIYTYRYLSIFYSVLTNDPSTK